MSKTFSEIELMAIAYRIKGLSDGDFPKKTEHKELQKRAVFKFPVEVFNHTGERHDELASHIVAKILEQL